MRTVAANMDNELLISEVFPRFAIWQSKHKHHRNRAVIDKMWEEISYALNSTKDEVRAKWKNLRDTYRKELRKTTKCITGDAGGQLKTSSWPFFELMGFLREEMGLSETASNLQFSINEISVNSLDDSEDVGNMQSQDRLSQDEEDELENNTLRSLTPHIEDIHSVRKRKGTQDFIANKIILLEDSKEELQKSNSEKGEDYHFLMSLLPHFTDMTSMEKLTVRNKIIQVIIDAKSSRIN